MKLLLTSNGLANQEIIDAFQSLVGKPLKEVKVVFIPTAAFAKDDDGVFDDKDWLINDMYRIRQLVGAVEIVSLADRQTAEVIRLLEMSDVIFVGGGNSFYLSYMFEKHGLFEALPKLLDTRVYAGISAGSMIATDSFRATSQSLSSGVISDGTFNELGPQGKSLSRTAQLIPIVLRPHFKSPNRPNITEELLREVAKSLTVPLYAIDDQCAIYVNGDMLKVVGDGNSIVMAPGL